jgi:hypothetical protein
MPSRRRAGTSPAPTGSLHKYGEGEREGEVGENSNGNFLLTNLKLFDILLSADNSKDREQYFENTKP